MIHATAVTSQDAWEAALRSLPASSFMQAWAWGEFKAGYGWRALRWMWADEADPLASPLAAAQVLERSLRFGPLTFTVSYVPKGPLLRSADAANLDRVLSDLEDHARIRRAIQIKIDPDIVQASRNSEETLEQPHAEGEQWAARLAKRGWRASAEQVQFRSTIVLELAPTDDALLAAMKQKTRYNIRLAARKGVGVRLGTPADLPLLYRMYAATAQRNSFVIRDKAYYDAAWGSFMLAGLAQAFIAVSDGRPVAAIIVFAYGRRACYVYGMSQDYDREKMPNHLLQWEAIRWARSRGCTIYDFWGAPDQPNPKDPLWGVYNFKQGFGGRFVRHLGAWDFAPNPALYAGYSLILPRVLGLMRLVARRRIRREAMSEGDPSRE